MFNKSFTFLFTFVAVEKFAFFNLTFNQSPILQSKTRSVRVAIKFIINDQNLTKSQKSRNYRISFKFSQLSPQIINSGCCCLSVRLLASVPQLLLPMVLPLRGEFRVLNWIFGHSNFFIEVKLMSLVANGNSKEEQIAIKQSGWVAEVGEQSPQLAELLRCPQDLARKPFSASIHSLHFSVEIWLNLIV